MKRSVVVTIVSCCCLASLSAQADKPIVSSWEKVQEVDGITVYRRDVSGSPIVALRGEGIVNASILRVASVIVDNQRAPEWVDSVAEVHTLRTTGEAESVEWDHVKTPFVLKDRDFVFKSKLELLPQQKQMVLNYHSVSDPLAPVTGYVRGEFVYGKFVMTSIDNGRKTRVLAELMCDPKGSVAKWLVNLFQKSWPYNTITSLRRQTQKRDIRENARLKVAMGQAYD